MPDLAFGILLFLFNGALITGVIVVAITGAAFWIFVLCGLLRKFRHDD